MAKHILVCFLCPTVYELSKLCFNRCNQSPLWAGKKRKIYLCVNEKTEIRLLQYIT